MESRETSPFQRIILLTSSFAPRVGGVEVAVGQLARELRARGYDVSIVTNRYPRTLPRFETIDDLPVYRILFPPIPRLATGLSSRQVARSLLLFLYAPVAIWQLWRLLRRLQPDIVNAHYLSTSALYAAAVMHYGRIRARLIVSCHGSDVLGPPYPAGSAALASWVCRHAIAITACSQALVGPLMALAPGLSTDQVCVVYNGAEIDTSGSDDDMTGQGAVWPRPYILTAGRLTPNKGMSNVIKAMAILRDRGLSIDLLIAGSGPEAANLHTQIQQLGLVEAVHLLGSLERQRLRHYYESCSAFVLASLREGLGIVCLEAMISGRPVVATRVGGIPEIVEDNVTGLLVRPADPVDLADKLSALLTDPDKAAELGRKGQERARTHFSWPIVANRYLKAYRFGLEKPKTDPEEPDRPLLSPFIRISRGESETVHRSLPRPTIPVRQSLAEVAQRVQKYRAWSPEAAVPILMYHQIAPIHPDGVKRSLLVTPAAFEAQLRLLSFLGWRSVRLIDIVEWLYAGKPLPRRCYVVTFDDAFEGVARYAVPVMRRFGVTATIFAPTTLLGTIQALDGGPDTPQKALMAPDQLRAVAALGHDIGAHTRSHARLPTLSSTMAQQEIVGSRDDLARLLGYPPVVFAYPYGAWTDQIAACVGTAGFRAACTTRFGRVHPGDDLLTLPRISVSVDLDLAHFAYRLARADQIARRSASYNAETRIGHAS